MKFFAFFKQRKHRDRVTYISVALSLLLAFLAVYLDEAMGASALTVIYIMQVFCSICWALALFMVGMNIWAKTKLKLEKRDREKGRDK